uniref:GLTP domain-containing protein n=1 Tax=Syphacia muris TaxID=451379 RepID=A0A0N5AC73_9BILA
MSSAFSAEDVIKHFEKALVDGADVNLREYIAAYREINKLFVLLGKIFSFVEADVQEKELILDRYCDDDSEHYATIGSMIEWETMDDIPSIKQGSRTLLRLHRALKFLCEFLGRLRNSSDDAQLSSICRASYECTLARYHPWLIRKGVALASYTLGSREAFVKTITSGSEQDNVTAEKVNSVIDRMIAVISNVYDRVEVLYSRKELLDLP